MKNLRFFFLSLFFLLSFSSAKHAYHVGSVEMDYGLPSKTFKITARFFLDDLENALSKKYNKSFRFNDPGYKAVINEAVKNYSGEYLKLKANNKFLKIKYIGYEEDQESVNIYLESEVLESPQKVETAVSFLYNLFDDQINIIHIIVNGERKSDKLTYPNRYLFQSF